MRRGPASPQRTKREAREATLVDAEVSDDQRAAFEHPGGGRALGLELAREALAQKPAGGLAIGRLQELDLDRGDDLAGGFGEPVLGEVLHQPGAEQRFAGDVLVERVGDELGVPLPFQADAAELGRVVAGIGCRMRGAVAVEQLDQVLGIGLRVALGSVLDGLQRQVQSAPRRLHRLEGPGMQLVRQRQALRVVAYTLDRHGSGYIASQQSRRRARWSRQPKLPSE